MKRIIAILLMISMLAVSLAACSGDSGKDTDSGKTTTAVSTTADLDAITTYLEPLDETLTELDFSGEEFVFLTRNDIPEDGEVSIWTDSEIYVEELMNEPINDAIYNRNLAVSETLGVEISQVGKAGYSEFNQAVGIMVNSGDTTYDAVAGSVFYSTPMIMSGYLYNLYDNGIDTYLDSEKTWWSQYWIKEAEMSDRLYMITGASALTLSRGIFAMYFNKNLAESYGMESLYDVVNRGDWTIDYCSELVSGIYRDLNGNDEKDEEDEYGLAINHYEHADMFWSSFDMSLITKNNDGWFELASDKEKISVAFEKVFDLIHTNTGTYDTGDSSGFNLARDMFASGSVLLAPLHLYYAESKEFRNMQDEYGIIPVPKYDEAQKEYYTYVHDQYSVFMVPCTVRNPEMTGAVLEVMAYESYKTLQPTYYDLVLKGRYANDAESRNMLDMITENVKVDASWIYAELFGAPAASVFRSLIYDGKRTFASTYAGVERKLPTVIKAIKKSIENLEY